MTPIGINLPNDQSVREQYGSKSVSLSNVNEAYDKSTLPEFRTEFSWTPEEAARAAKWGALAGELTTNMHEVIGHASGKVEERLKGNPQAALKEQFSALEEARADLVALYFLPDPKVVELGLVAKEDHDEVVRAEYEAYTRNAIVQLRRVREGTQLEEDHMRNRQMIVRWLMANTEAIDVRTRDGKTYYVMTDRRRSAKGRAGCSRKCSGSRRRATTRPRSSCSKPTACTSMPALRDEVVARVDHLKLPSYTGFVMPKLEAVTGPSGAIDRRHHFVSARLRPADARVFGRDAAAPAVNVLVPHSGDLTPNRLTAALTAARAGGRTILDLTESNPTRAGFEYPGDLLRPARGFPRTDLRACALRPARCPRGGRARLRPARPQRDARAHRADGQHE